jgi:hypothetical protein
MGRMKARRAYGPSPFTDAGAGRRAMPFTRRVRIYLHTTTTSDQSFADSAALTKADYGQWRREDQLYGSLIHFMPQRTPSGNMLIEPLHPIDSAGGPPSRKAPDPGFVTSFMDFEAKYIPAITVDDPPQ